MSQVMIPKYNTKTFAQLFDSSSAFITAVKGSFAKDALSDSELALTYGLLYARYKNDPLANLDEDQSKSMIYSVIFRFGPSWSKRLEIQNNLRNLSEEDICKGSKAIYNKAFNPSTEPSTATLEEIPEINEQTTSKNSRSRIEGYAFLLTLIKTDVTSEYIDKFEECFKQFYVPDCNAIYIDED